MSHHQKLNDEGRWQAVLERSPGADGQFVFAVLTTGIFCRPSCRARHPLRQNVQFYPDPAAAEAAGFRPCKRCQPTQRDPQQRRNDIVARACRLLEQDTTLTLEALAQQVAVSPYHLHRQFKAVTGMTPKAWQQAWRARRLRDALAQGESVTRSVLAAGFPDSSSYYRRADATLGMTAKQYRDGGIAQTIYYQLSTCSLGQCLIAESQRGICAVLLGDDEASLLAELQSLFPQASRVAGDDDFRLRINDVLAIMEGAPVPERLPLDIRGSAFQQRVWQALREIPRGETRSYQQIATQLGNPKAVRAVAGACAANRLALVIPCHRVVRQSGALSGYRWGEARKAEILKREAS